MANIIDFNFKVKDANKSCTSFYSISDLLLLTIKMICWSYPSSNARQPLQEISYLMLGSFPDGLFHLP